MYAGSNTAKKHKSTGGISGYLARPKLGVLRNMYASKSSFKPTSGYGYEKRQKARKSSENKMEFRKRPDYADTAYREAVSRLRVLLAESYTPLKRPIKELDSGGEETDNQSLTSGISRTSRLSHLHYRYSPNILKRYYYTPARRTPQITRADTEKTVLTGLKWDANRQPPELMSFIDRQEDYIEQLEKESKVCRNELTTLLRKVKDIITENEDLHDKQKSSLLKSVFNRLETDETETETETENKKSVKPPKQGRRVALEGPTIVFESRISELEAHLTQAKIELRKALDDNDAFKQRIAEGTLLSEGIGLDTHRKQIDNLQREKNTLQDTVNKLQNALVQLRDKDSSSTDQVKRSLDAAEQAQYEKNAAEHEIRRLKEELERQHGKLRDAISEQSRRVSDERSAVERRYSQQIEQLTTELGVQWEANSKLQLELDKQRRENADLRRELAQKTAHIDELKKEMQNKIANMQSDIGVSGAEKSALEQQISTLQLANDRNERQSRQEVTRLQAELQSLRQRLDRSDSDLIHSRRENIRLGEQIATLEKEINMNSALSEERRKPNTGTEILALPPPKEDHNKDLSSMVKDIETKHAATVAELEGMIHSQNQLMEKLTGECHTLTLKLEENSTQHKEEIRELQTNLDYLSSRIVLNTMPQNQYQHKDEEYNMPSTKRSAPHNQQILTNKNLSRTSSNASIKPPTPTSLVRKPSVQYSAVENQHYKTDNNNQQFTADYDNQIVQPYGTDSNQYAGESADYEADPNQYGNYTAQDYEQYNTDQQYASDPNQYTYDPNLDYSQYPDQYVTEPNAVSYPPADALEENPTYQQESPNHATKPTEKETEQQ